MTNSTETSTVIEAALNSNNCIRENQAILSEKDFINQGIKSLPYTSKLNFQPLIKDWENKLDSEDFAERLLAKEILIQLKDAPELLHPIEDYCTLGNYKELLDLLLAGLSSINLRDKQLIKASRPFDMNPFYVTPALKNLMADKKILYKIDKSPEQFFKGAVVRMAGLILQQCYDQNIDLQPNMIFSIECPETGIQRHYKTKVYNKYVKVKKLKPLKKLSQEVIDQLLGNKYDLETWFTHLPPSNFEIQGIVGIELIDITEDEIRSRLKFSLLERDAVIQKRNILQLQQLLRSYFQIPGLRLGITAIDFPADRSVQHDYKIRFDFLADKHKSLLTRKNRNSIYEKACKSGELLLIEDLEKIRNKTPIENDLIKESVRCILIAPLKNKDNEVIGMMEIGSPNPFELNSFTEEKFMEIAPLFSMAVERSRQEIDNRIEAIIRENFTTIHPSVEWKFIENAFELLGQDEEGKSKIIPPIVFEDVYPLYAQADIVGSSRLRNEAIREDFLDNLKLIKMTIWQMLEQVDFPLLDRYLLETESLTKEIKQEFKSNDETKIMDFIKLEIHPLFKELSEKHSSLETLLKTYYKKLDASFGVIYKKRKKYEDSVSMINETLSQYLEKEDRRSQQMIPHYFEKYKTDGVEYEIYAGQSIQQKEKFSPIHLKNLRLWQLISMCEITRKVSEIRGELPIPLSTAQLIFVYGNSISIRFRMDDKHFDVEGAYNIRYEIIKKRIDKALIEGTTERLTQDGKIAIVYTSEQDKWEYQKHLNYLHLKGYIEKEIEELTLGKLQGVQGLKALRITVKIK
ncbi:MAG: GAF domain-containing protein [Bacteroidetes bacterium]|nr:GAF domain-containing protein [Bacteroidota bacterium]